MELNVYFRPQLCWMDNMNEHSRVRTTTYATLPKTLYQYTYNANTGTTLKHVQDLTNLSATSRLTSRSLLGYILVIDKAAVPSFVYIIGEPPFAIGESCE